MKFRTMILAALASSVLVAGAADAQGIDQRHANQEARIANGVHDGALAPGERRAIEHQQRSIDRQESRMRYRDGGRLTPHDRWVLQHRENRASRHIYRAKHNRWHA